MTASLEARGILLRALKKEYDLKKSFKFAKHPIASTESKNSLLRALK